MSKCDDYKSFDEFQMDIYWFTHNCHILYPGHSAICINAKKLTKAVEEEIYCVKKCVECYFNAYNYPENSFVLLCNEPHPIIWAKPIGYRYWPAKLISSQNGTVHVRFFGDHLHADLPGNECYLYTEDPLDEANESDPELFQQAIEVS